MNRFCRALACCLLALTVGCSSANRPGAIPAASYDPAAITDALLREYDRNGNGSLEAAELNGCPALKGALAVIDSNKDGKLSREELLRRFEAYAAAGRGSVVSCSCLVKLDGKPLSGVQVKLIPEKAMGSSFLPATGVTNADGVAVPKVEGDTRAGIPSGLYRIQITRDASGQVDVPAVYASGARLGREVFDDGRSGGGLIQLALTSSGR